MSLIVTLVTFIALLGTNREVNAREPFDYFYHTTDMKYQIVRSGIINEDTHFCCTLLHGEIPDKLSYYGNYRVGVDAREVLSTFFDDPRLYFISSSKQRKPTVNIWYHNLLLTDSYHHGLPYLDIEDNDYLTMDLESDNFFVKQNNSGECIRVRNRFIPEYHWVNVQIDPEVDIYSVDHWWD